MAITDELEDRSLERMQAQKARSKGNPTAHFSCIFRATWPSGVPRLHQEELGIAEPQSRSLVNQEGRKLVGA